MANFGPLLRNQTHSLDVTAFYLVRPTGQREPSERMEGIPPLPTKMA